MNRHAPRFVPIVLGALLLSSVPSCVSLDAKPDVEKAAASVRERSGYVVPWDEPWAMNLSWDGSSSLTIDQAVLAALANNGEIRALVEQVAASRADLAQAGLLPNPVVSISVRVPLDGGPVISPVGVSVTQSFVALWLRGPRMKAADARLNQSILTLSNSALQLVADVKTAHAKIVFGQRAQSLADAGIARAEHALRTLRQHTESGTASSLDADRLQQLILRARADQTRRCMMLDRERRELLHLMGLAGVTDRWSAVDAVPESDDPSLYPPSLPPSLTDESAQALALSQRLDVVASLAVVEANKKDLSAQERSRIRDLGIGVVVQRTQNELRSLGLQNSIPIFDFNQAQIAKSGSLGRAALATAESVFQRAIMEARVGLGEARAAQALALDYRQGALPLARTNFERANRALHDGIVDVNTLLGTLETLADDEQSANDLDLLAVAARIELERAVGGSMTSTPVPREPDPTPAADAPGP